MADWMQIDLHIHTAASPCADEEMTPWNIVRMAQLEGLKLIAVTDHNTIANAWAVMEVGKQLGLAVLPGIEVQTREEVHLLGIFPTLEQASAFQELIWNRLPDVPNHPEVFGEQILYDSSDRPIGTVKRLLLQSVMLGVEEVGTAIKVCGGLTIAAHVNRRSYSLIGQLAVVPEGLKLDAVEIDRSLSYRGFLEKFQELGCYPVLCSSDAHRLTDLVGSHRPRLFLDEASFAALEELLHSDDRSRIQFG
ncbi:MAG TPA: PHP domain-containing protein [Firmicutes bacterium]|nr:PHP domain-containing protein [Bacillota bacterium]